jgi:replicative DNA helicase
MEERKDKITKGLQIGLKTGLSFFDDNMIGWLPGNLIAIIGRPGIGKSWLLMYLACFAYYFGGARVAYLSPEMAIPEVEDRWDTIKSAFEGEGFSNESLTSGKVNLPKYKKYLESTSKRNDWVTLDSNEGKAFSLASAQSIVDEFQPDLVCVDGLILMDSGNAGDGESWEAMRKLAYGLKNIAQNNKIVIMAASQAGRNAAGAMPELHQIYGGDALAQAADVAIMVSDVAEAGNEAEAFTRYITIPKRRSGKTFAKKMKLRFNVDRGSIGL